MFAFRGIKYLTYFRWKTSAYPNAAASERRVAIMMQRNARRSPADTEPYLLSELLPNFAIPAKAVPTVSSVMATTIQEY